MPSEPLARAWSACSLHRLAISAPIIAARDHPGHAWSACAPTCLRAGPANRSAPDEATEHDPAGGPGLDRRGPGCGHFRHLKSSEKRLSHVVEAPRRLHIVSCRRESPIARTRSRRITLRGHGRFRTAQPRAQTLRHPGAVRSQAPTRWCRLSGGRTAPRPAATCSTGALMKTPARAHNPAPPAGADDDTTTSAASCTTMAAVRPPGVGPGTSYRRPGRGARRAAERVTCRRRPSHPPPASARLPVLSVTRPPPFAGSKAPADRAGAADPRRPARPGGDGHGGRGDDGQRRAWRRCRWAPACGCRWCCS